MDLIGPIDPPSSKGHKYILCLVDQHTRWGEVVPLTSLSAKVLRMLEQFVVSRIVDIDILMQIWKNRVKQINFVLEWVRWNHSITHRPGGACKDLLSTRHDIERGSGNDRGEKGPNEERTGERWSEKRGRIKERLRDDGL
ncbi:hypothetical protein TNCV_3221941 [Trichonephila clavipes]|nr:hypothetical protein TNCV_3221941 [Trichonephila clavipes]